MSRLVDILLPFFQTGMLFINVYLMFMRFVAGYEPPPQFNTPLSILFLLGNALMILVTVSHSLSKEYNTGLRDGENMKLKKEAAQ